MGRIRGIYCGQNSLIGVKMGSNAFLYLFKSGRKVRKTTVFQAKYGGFIASGTLTVARRQALTHFTGLTSGTDPDNITFAGLDFQKGDSFFSKMRYLYEKGAGELIFSCALEFLISTKRAASPKSGSCSKFISVKNIAKPSSAGRNECFVRNGDEVHSRKLYTFIICSSEAVSSPRRLRRGFSFIIWYAHPRHGGFLHASIRIRVHPGVGPGSE